jgi:hypothetical protein
VGFDLFLDGAEQCGETYYVVFAVQNRGGAILKTARVHIERRSNGQTLHGPAFDRFPFAKTVRPVCPPDHGNILLPGQVMYIHVPISPVPRGEEARVSMMLCTADYLGGECVTRALIFVIP